ncbi:flagellar hook-length control protein FliK [Phyllobacterium brassicacearum]|nr:flagellar hook-length control protein FliK [Phyllobacterium brassicacearum]TDQ29613.1 flagellar hook-length control protein FliK [Phyllobacterium brassicacearum]
MPLRSQLDALVRDKGNGKHASDQKSAKETDIPADFKTIVKTVLPKLTPDKEDAAVENLPRDVTKPDVDLPASPTAGLFGQAILAFEQLLDRQRHENADQTQPTDDTKLSANADAASSVIAETLDVEGEEQTEALPDKKTERLAQRATPKSEEPAPAVSQTTQTPAKPGVEQGQVTEPGQLSPETPMAKSTPKEPAEKPSLPVADTAMSSSSQPAPAEVKPNATAQNNAPATPTVRPPVTGILVLSERTAGGTKTLMIQLQPIELGTVTARMRLTSEGMHIQLTAESREMAEHLASDHEALGKALQRAGVADDTSPVTIAVIDRSSAPSIAQTGQQNLTGQEQQANGRANGQPPSASQGSPDQRSPGQQTFGEFKLDDRDEVSAKTGAETRPSRGLVV